MNAVDSATGAIDVPYSEKFIEYLRNVARKLYDWRWYRLSLGCYNVLVKLEPDNDNTWHDRGIIYGKFGQYDKALADYHKALEIYPEHDRAYYNIANVFAYQDQHQQALVYFEKALSLNNRGLYWFGLALSQKSLGNDPDAFTSIKKAIKLGDSDEEIDAGIFESVFESWGE